MQREVQGEDGEDYMKKVGMIRSRNDGMHTKLLLTTIFIIVFIFKFPKTLMLQC